MPKYLSVCIAYYIIDTLKTEIVRAIDQMYARWLGHIKVYNIKDT